MALEARFGSPLNLGDQDSFHIARFLRVLNSAFNLDIASQRLSAASTLVGRFGNTRADIQTALLDLAREELNDALAVLSFQSGLYTSAQSNINQANVQIAAGIAATTASARQSQINSALTSMRNARGQFGSNIVFQMGQGNLMF